MQRVKALSTIALLLLTAKSPTARAEMPTYDVEGHCRKVGEMAGGSEEMRNFCLNEEQSAYNAMKPIWDGLPPSIRSHCESVGQMAGGSFEMLKFCVEEETKAAKANQQFHFQR